MNRGFVLVNNMNKIIGIYKITSPSNKIYIGQSIDIYKRFSQYKKLECKRQKKIYSSLLKHGAINHVFEIIEECGIEYINERERYWQEFFDVLSKNGLNLQLVNCNNSKQVHSQETKNKISKANKGKTISEESKLKLSIAHKGKKLSEEHKIKISISNSGSKNGQYGKIGMLSKNFGRIGLRGELHPSFGKLGKDSKSYGKLASEETKKKMSESSNRKRLILCIDTGIFYFSLVEAAIIYNLPEKRLSSYLLNTRNNKTNLIYV